MSKSNTAMLNVTGKYVKFMYRSQIPKLCNDKAPY